MKSNATFNLSNENLQEMASTKAMEGKIIINGKKMD